MKIAQIAPLSESVPPRAYGGTERVVYYLTEELVRQGHQVTLFASGDSQTSAELRPIVPEAMRLARASRDPMIWYMLQLAAVGREVDGFDIVHFHTGFLHYPLWRHLGIPQVSTLHGRLDLPDLASIYMEFRDMAVVSISDSQRLPLPMARWVATVYDGVPEDLYDFRSDPGDYLVFLGRISPEKGIDTAIEIALRANIPLKIAAKVDSVDQVYFNECIRPRLNHPLIDYVGEVDEQEKNGLLGGAWALLFPIAWPEPFGLVMIEAMACGTPIIAFQRGSVPEVMIDGVTGYIVSTPEEAVAALKRIDRIDRHACRRHFETHFSARRMAQGYLAVYHQLIQAVETKPEKITYSQHLGSVTTKPVLATNLEKINHD